MIRSLRWRLQVWHALVLMAVLTIFGAVVYGLQWQTRLQNADAELDQTADVIASRIERLFPWPVPFRRNSWGVVPPTFRSGENLSRSSNSNKEATPPETVATEEKPKESEASRDSTVATPSRRTWSPPPGLGLPDEFMQLFEGRESSRLYYVVWRRGGEMLQRSNSAPDLPFPNLHAGVGGLPKRTVRMRGDYREVIHVTRYDNHVLVGRSIRRELTAQHRTAVLLVLAGSVVLVVGLVGGWWLSSRAIQPISAMSVTAESISAKNLSSRIDVSETDNELGQLAAVLNRTFDRLESAFEQQSRFTTDASHELRTPLSVILSHTELALSRQRSREEYQAALQACRRASQRMKTLIDSLLTLARLDSLQPVLDLRPIDLELIARDAVELVRPLAAERRIEIHTATTPTCVTGDRERLSQVFVNLLSNAIRYNHDGGCVNVSIYAKNGQGVVRVMDTGVGISQEDLPHIFERFFRVDKARSRAEGGCGLGLAICQSIVQAHGGTITARSQLQSGTTIEVHLPGVLDDLPSAESRPITQEPTLTKCSSTSSGTIDVRALMTAHAATLEPD